ncbi:MAG: D-glycero-beta-D-manno-heptose 1-phosphate adenylyltransferase [Candidatus Eisenbacteria bacterium]|uniref:D-glycero-beta-D-manno-heptose 1-phosphate adenylyltransferase n=1 Tax=Eiseniibacteriota bacterium TaxID=2212470 RepID=A0A538TYR4_UNCEI|nr:MAG: D-glycero-beta-D-manno-heptose 1-phosphate adenylyltransferase [Candidatus Eisenbacteria bacterium]
MTGAPSILAPEQRDRLAGWRAAGERIVFTNGVFDLLHRGHVEYLEEARALGDRLVVGVNSDASVRRVKGPTRPLVPDRERAELLAALAAVDMVVVFEDDTPLGLIMEVEPDVLAKGGDWPLERIVGREFVEGRGGRVAQVALREGISTTAIIERILAGKSALDP